MKPVGWRDIPTVGILLSHRGNPAEDDACAKRQHTANEVIAQTVQGLSLWIAEHLQEPAYQNQGKYHVVSLSVDQQAIDDIQFYHQSEEPVDAWPDDLVWCWQYIDIHKQLGNDVVPMELEAPWGYDIHDDEEGEAHYQHP